MKPLWRVMAHKVRSTALRCGGLRSCGVKAGQFGALFRKYLEQIFENGMKALESCSYACF